MFDWYRIVCLYIPLLHLLAVRPVQSLSACTVQLYLYSHYGPYCLYRASVPVQYTYNSNRPIDRTAIRVISPSQRPPPDNTQHSQQQNVHTPGGIRTYNLSRREAADLRLRPSAKWERPALHLTFWIIHVTCSPYRRRHKGKFTILITESCANRVLATSSVAECS